jgi:hypothetical protein
MRTKAAILLVLILCLTAKGEEFASVGALFDIGMGARPLGMGGAFVGLADDENAVFYNPAGLAFLKTAGLSSLYSRQFGFFDYASVGFAMRFVGANLLQIHSNLPVTNQFGNPIGEISYMDLGGMVSLGVSFGWLAMGTRVKIYQASWTIDPAVMLNLGSFRLGGILENALSKPITFEDHIENWKMALRLGGSVSLATDQVTLNILVDFDRRLHIGVELWADDLGVRAGVNGESLTWGVSIYLNKIRVDWAHSIHPWLPDTDRLSVIFRF